MIPAPNCIKHFHWTIRLFSPIRFDFTIVSTGNNCNIKPDWPEPPQETVVKSNLISQYHPVNLGKPLYNWVLIGYIWTCRMWLIDLKNNWKISIIQWTNRLLEVQIWPIWHMLKFQNLPHPIDENTFNLRLQEFYNHKPNCKYITLRTTRKCTFCGTNDAAMSNILKFLIWSSSTTY